MLTLRMGVWEKDKSGSSSGNFKIFGKRFVVFVDRNERAKDNKNAPAFWVTIKEFPEDDK